MPSKNAQKVYVEGGIYHIFNRGVDKRDIFLDDQDYAVFLNRLKDALSPEDEILLNVPSPRRKNHQNNLALITYCLMPNHFHLLMRQSSERGITEFMKTIATSYSSYFNKKYKRSGALFQGRFHALLVDRDEYLMHVSRYIHMNPKDIGKDYRKYPYSSYGFFSKNDAPSWLNIQPVLELFDNDTQQYVRFVNDLHQDSAALIGDLAID